jgi:monoamine oxidase
MDKYMQTDGQTKSIWYDIERPPQGDMLRGDAQADVAIVGGGIAGLSVAYMLAREGKQVVVLEDKEVAAGQTGRSTAQLSTAVDERFTEIEKLHGADGARVEHAPEVVVLACEFGDVCHVVFVCHLIS